MEMICEFCKSLCPVVYCTADAAYLCLSCDSKVHSANALSYRHDRSLVCQSCGSKPASVRCLERHIFMCQSCYTTGHAWFQHRKSKVISSYMGSPSAKELAVFWGFDLNKFESEEGSSNRGTKVGTRTCLILQQILDLEKLQLSGSIRTSRSLQAKEPMNFTWKTHKTINTTTDHIDRGLDFREPMDSPYDETVEGESLHGELFWQCERPAPNNESWFNMQDIGVCDEVQCFDDISIPELDLTFRNFEELFGSEHEASGVHVNDKNAACSNAEKHSWFGELDSEYASTIEDVAGDPLVFDIPQSYSIYKQIDSFDKNHRLETVNSYLLQTKPSYPESSFSVSRINGEQNVMKRNKEKKVLSVPCCPLGVRSMPNIHPTDQNVMEKVAKRTIKGNYDPLT